MNILMVGNHEQHIPYLPKIITYLSQHPQSRQRGLTPLKHVKKLSRAGRGLLFKFFAQFLPLSSLRQTQRAINIGWQRPMKLR